MTRDEVLAMEPGRLLDALVAEYVVGMKEHRKAYPESFDERVIWFRDPPNVTAYYVPFYSTDISAAWVVVEKMFEHGGCEIGCYGSKSGGKWFEVNVITMNGEVTVTAHTAHEAICKAALLAVMEE